MTGHRLELLGGFRLLEPSGQPVELRSRKARALLVYLALRPKRCESRERLAGLLWGEMGEERARANLRQAVSDLRRVLGDDAAGLASEGDLVSLDARALDVDVWELREAAERGDLARAARLYGGELASDLVVHEEPWEDWLRAESLALQRLAASVSERLANEKAQALALPLPAMPSIAVLPFEDLTEPGSAQHVGDGIAEDVIVELSKFDTILVIARQSSFVFRDRAADTSAIGRALGVHYVLDGSVRRSAGRIRVSAQLADASSGGNVWAERYDGAIDDVLELENEVTQRIVATLVGRVEADHKRRLARKAAETFEAHDYLWQGKMYHHRSTPEDNRRARDCVERAIALDPSFALAHAWLACILAQGYGFHPDANAMTRAYEHALRAQELEDGQSECHRILAAWHITRRTLDVAMHHQERALSINPNDDRIICQMGELLTLLGRAADGIGWIEKSMRLNPFHPESYVRHYGRALYGADRNAEALAAFRRIARAHALDCAFVAACCARLGDRAGAAAATARVRRARPNGDAASLAAAIPYAEARDRETLERDLRAVGL